MLSSLGPFDGKLTFRESVRANSFSRRQLFGFGGAAQRVGGTWPSGEDMRQRGGRAGVVRQAKLRRRGDRLQDAEDEWRGIYQPLEKTASGNFGDLDLRVHRYVGPG